MTDLLISKAAPTSKSLDFETLRKEGVKHIQELAGKIWTDFNLHDPGVTTLEVLSYAITELGYRTNSNIEDILASKPESDEISLHPNFFKASKIFPCSPVTENDLRKVLIDHPDIKNAWFEKSTSSEQSFMLDQTTNSLSFTTGDIVSLNGLYKVLLEFQDSDLNRSIIERTINVSGEDIAVEFAFPFWDEMEEQWSSDIAFTSITVPDGLVIYTDEVTDDYFAVIHGVSGTDTHKVGTRINVISRNDSISETVLQNAIITEIESNTPSGLLKTFNNKIIAALNIIENIKEVLAQHRNLCEDYYSFKAARIQEISIDANVQIYSGANLEKILAKIFYVVDQFLSPDIKFLYLSEALAKGKSTDEIFEGPLLTNGFIFDDDLDKLDIGDHVFTSDLLNLILSLNDEIQASYSNNIIALNELTISNYVNNREISANVRNCLHLIENETYKPKLSISKSLIRFYKDGMELSYNTDTVQSEFNLLKSSATTTISTLTDIEIPTGNRLDLDDYYSIQNHFPITYGIGKEGIPGAASEETISESERNLRIAQSRQMKAYLVFFEQILANFFSQLSHVRDLFSRNSAQDTTYFFQPLYDVPDVKYLLKGFTSSAADLDADWKPFKEAINNDYITALEQTITNEEEFIDRRNRFLDHLIGRFSESFVEYALLLKAGGDNLKNLIFNKCDFLNDYPVISSNRFLAYNYSKLDTGTPDVWDTYNVSGLQKRIARLLGIKSYRRRNLYNDPNLFSDIITTSGGSFRARIFESLPTVFLISKNYSTNVQAISGRNQMIENGQVRSNYRAFYNSGIRRYQARLYTSGGTFLGRVPGSFITKTDLFGKVDNIVDFLHEKFSSEGLYLVEHILLRPLTVPAVNPQNYLLPVELDENEQAVEPYSFVISVILPSGFTTDDPPVAEAPVRFGNEEFRAFAGKVIRREVPAHIKVNIYWVDRLNMIDFEATYRIWLTNKADPAITETDLINSQQDLISMIKLIQTL